MSGENHNTDAVHWPEYLIEAAGLGLFMLAAGAVGILLEHPASPIHLALPAPLARRALAGVAMAATAMMLIYSRWGRRSGAHFNPAVTLAFWFLGKVAARDAVAYILFQFAGGALGMLAGAALMGRWLAAPQVHYVATTPGPWGPAAAWLAEAGIAALLMTVVLRIFGRPALAPFTGVCAACCVFLFITFEGPVSGMSMNPARTLASALAARDWTALWVYFTAPPLGMAAAAWWHVRRTGGTPGGCAKLMHSGPGRCIFCEYQARRQAKAI